MGESIQCLFDWREERIKRRIDERTDFGRQTDFIDFYPDFDGASASPHFAFFFLFSLTLAAMPIETRTLSQYCRCMDDAIRRNKNKKEKIIIRLEPQ